LAWISAATEGELSIPGGFERQLGLALLEEKPNNEGDRTGASQKKFQR
jgi:hypothetical protein